MGLPSQCFIEGSHLGRLAPLGTPSDPSLPLERANEADDLALHKAFKYLCICFLMPIPSIFKGFMGFYTRKFMVEYLLRTHAPHCGQRGQEVGRRARAASTDSTRWLARTRANDHAARISAGSVWPLQPCRASVARRDHHRVCCR